MFVQSVKFIEAHGGKRSDISIYGQESNPTTWKLCAMNLAIRGIEANLGEENGDSFRRDLHADLKADFVIANPPFNDSNWNGELLKEDVRWHYGVPPAGNANFAWVQHFVHHLAPHGTAGFVLANGSLSSQQSGEGDIRRAMIEGDVVDCIVALPPQLFYSTQISVCLWFVAKDRSEFDGVRDRRGEVLFIDARNLGSMIDRTHRELNDDDITRIAATYHAWRGEKSAGEYQDVPAFCGVASTAEVLERQCVLTPGQYVGLQALEDDAEPLDEKIARLKSELVRQFGESDALQTRIARVLEWVGE